jgi:hypothetical protein
MNYAAITRPLWLLACLGLAVVGGSGCLAVAAGVAGGALGYAYYQGNVRQVFPANFDDTFTATRAALADLNLPVESEEMKPFYGVVRCHATDGTPLKIVVVGQANTETGPATQVGVRVGQFGDHSLSARILDQIGSRLIPQPVPVGGQPTTLQAIAPASPTFVPPAAATPHSPAVPPGREPPLAD